MLAAEVEHLLRLGNTANERTGKAFAAEQQTEGGDRHRLVGRADERERAVETLRGGPEADAPFEDRAFWDRVMNPETQVDTDLAHAVHLIRATGAAEATIQEAEAYAALAKAALRTLPESPYREALEDLADFCVSRAF